MRSSPDIVGNTLSEPSAFVKQGLVLSQSSVIASEAKQSQNVFGLLRRYAPRNDDKQSLPQIDVPYSPCYHKAD